MAKRVSVGIVSDNTSFAELGDVKPDSKHRVVLKGKVHAHYRIYINMAGQVLLDPMVMVPAREAWLYENKDAHRAVRQGLADSKAGRLKKMKSLAKYADAADDE